MFFFFYGYIRRMEIEKNTNNENEEEAYALNLCNVNSFGNVYVNFVFYIRNHNNYTSYVYKGNY